MKQKEKPHAKEKIQALLFNKNDFTKNDAIHWLERHNIMYLKIHTTNVYHRARLIQPKYGINYKYRTITFSDFPNIKAILQIKS